MEYCVWTQGWIQDFPRRSQLPRVAPTYDFAKFSRKLHEIKRIWVPGGSGLRTPKSGTINTSSGGSKGGAPGAPPMDPLTIKLLRSCSRMDSKSRVGKPSHTHTWMKSLNTLTSAKPVMSKLQNVFVALVKMGIFKMTLKLNLFTVFF